MLGLSRALPLVILIASVPSSASAAQEPAGAIRGVVLESRDGPAVAHVLVRLQDTGRAVLTDDTGHFELTDVRAGVHELYVSVVDFILVKRALDVAAGQATDVTIVLTEGTGSLAESVTIIGQSAGPGNSAAGTQVLHAKDLQQLRGLVTNDPFRAIQVLPGVATGDDLKSEFTLRGHASDHMLFTFEGVATPLLVHSVQRVNDTGSVAMINGDVLDEVLLVGGAYPQRQGGRLGAELDFRMREGSRARTEARLSISGTDSALVLEGPAGGRGSWLTSIRKSYLDLITSRLDTGVDFTFGFTDTQTKIVYDVNAANQVQFALAGGRSRLNLDPADIDSDDPRDARNASGLAVLSWRRAVSPRLMIVQRAALGLGAYRNTNTAGIELARGVGRDALYRTEWTYAPGGRLGLEGGGEVRATTQSRHDVAIVSSTRIEARESFDAGVTASSGFVQMNARGARWTLTPGVRIDHSTLTGGTSASPWLQATARLTPALAWHAGASIARQRPTVDEVVGQRGTIGLGAETAYNGDVGVEGPLVRHWRWRLDVYAREERDVIDLPDTDYRRVNNTLVIPSLTSRYRNLLAGRARGAEAVIERRSANGLSGWASYSYGRTRYHDAATGEWFWGDYDQRHTVNAYGLYRFSDRSSASARFRGGSNFPTPGYWEAAGGAYVVGTTRNDLRVPAYARLDLRVNRTFTKRRARLTLFLEVLNALGRGNVRAATPGVNRRTRVVTDLYESLIPLVPSAGLLVEF